MAEESITWPDLSDPPLGHTVEVQMAAAAPALYEAWTEGFDAWFAAPGTVLMRGEVNAPSFFETHFEGRSHAHYGRFLALEPDRRVVITRLAGTPGTAGAETIVTVKLGPFGAGTRLRLTHAGFLDEVARAENEAAWQVVLPHLDEVLTAH
jgi:uncharacterized protein YndB with AHSA1/START domain